MNTSSLHDSAKSRSSPRLLSVASATLMLLWVMSPGAASGKPTAIQVNNARADCAARKHRVEALEARESDDQTLTQQRVEWEHACAHAESLMEAAGMDGHSSSTPHAAASPSVITIVEPAQLPRDP